MVNKKGVSSIVATVLLVLITVTAAGVIWQAVIPMVNKALQMNQACMNARLTIDTTSGYTCYDENKKQASIMVSRGAENFELSGIQIGLSSEGKTEKHEIRQRSEIDSYTKSLLHMEGSDGSTIFTDEIDKTVTANGNAQISIVGGSALFDGTGDYLTLVDSDDWYFGTGDFTIEGWVRFNDLSTDRYFISQYEDDDNIWRIYWATDGKIRMWFEVGGALKGYYYFSWWPSLNTWYHLTFERVGSTAKIFIDGVSQSLTEFTAFGSNDVGSLSSPLYIGSWVAGAGALNGRIDEFRISKGIARWTSNFIPQTNTYTKDSYTKLLMHSDGRNGTAAFIDDTGKTITANGNAQIDTAQYKVNGGKFGQAGLFDGTGDYLTIPASTDWNFNGDFTIDFWWKGAGLNTNLIKSVTTGTNGAETTGDWILFTDGNGWTTFAIWGGGNAGGSAAVLTTGTWYHIAVVRSGSTTSLYINGVQKGTTITSTATFGNTKMLNIGQNEIDLVLGLNGWIDEVRISKGIARWTSNFVPPSLAYENIEMPQTNSAITYTISSDSAIALASVAPIVKVGISERTCAITHTTKTPKCV